MSNLAKGTALADSVRDECACVRDCDHADCPRAAAGTPIRRRLRLHPQVLVDAQR